MRRRPRPLTAEQRQQLEAAERHADKVVEIVRILEAADKHLRGASRELGNLLTGEPEGLTWTSRRPSSSAVSLFESAARFGGLVSVTGTQEQLAAIEQLREQLLGSYAGLVERYRGSGSKKLREAVVVRRLRLDGWADGAIAQRLFRESDVQKLVDRYEYSDEEAERQLYMAAHKRVRGMVL